MMRNSSEHPSSFRLPRLMRGRLRTLSLALVAVYCLPLQARAQRLRCEGLPQVSLATPERRVVALGGLVGSSEAVVILYGRIGQSRTERAIADLTTLAQAYRARTLVILLVATERHGGFESAQKLAKSLDAAIQVLVDRGDSFRAACGLFVYPTVLLFDRAHRLRGHYVGHRIDFQRSFEAEMRKVFHLPQRVYASTSRPVAEPGRRKGRLSAMMRKRDRRRAERRLLALRQLLSLETLSMVFRQYHRWSDLMEEPESAPLAAALGGLARAKAPKDRSAALATLKHLSAGKGFEAAQAQLALGRALAAANDPKGAQAAFEACRAQSGLRGQCEFELAALSLKVSPVAALELVKAAYKALSARPAAASAWTTSDSKAGPKKNGRATRAPAPAASSQPTRPQGAQRRR